MIKINEGVDVVGLHDIMWKAVYNIKSLFDDRKLDCVITSALEGKHGRGSLHYVGLAVDIRTRELNKPIELLSDIRNILGDGYDVVYEGTHFHIEYQPKNQTERLI